MSLGDSLVLGAESKKQKTAVQPHEPRQGAPYGRRWHLFVCVVAMLLTAAAYSNSLRGDFIYDDDVQIVQNDYIKQDRYLWHALTTDVWSFRTPEEGAQSNYWRPAFVAWLAINYRLFELNTTGWHLLSILAHMLVTLLAYQVFVKLKLRPDVAAMVTWAFATHPLHVQSVTWISGVPDVLMGGFLLASFLCYLGVRERQRWYLWASALVLYLAALLSKEVAVTFPAIIFLTTWILDRENRLANRDALNHALKRSLPFVAVAVLFVAARYQVLQMVRLLAPSAPGLDSVLMTLPSLLVFYVRQVVFPFMLSPFHPLRPVTGANIGFTNFFLPLALTLGIGYLAFLLLQRKVAYRHGLVWFLIPLATAFDTRVFTHEQQVQDRYLYLPLLGALIIAAGLLVEAVERWGGPKLKKIPAPACLAGAAIAILLAVLAIRYNSVWNNDLAFLQHSVRMDPDSAIAHYLLGEDHMKEGRLDDARAVLTRALEIAPKVIHINVSMGRLANRQRRFDEAERYLERVVKDFPQYALAVDQLGLAYQEQGKTDQAIALFERSRQNIPRKRLLYTNHIALLHRIANRPASALAELESQLSELNSSVEPDVLIGWFYLGELYREQGRADQARSAYQKYLDSTLNPSDARVEQIRERASMGIASLR